MILSRACSPPNKNGVNMHWAQPGITRSRNSRQKAGLIRQLVTMSRERTYFPQESMKSI